MNLLCALPVCLPAVAALVLLPLEARRSLQDRLALLSTLLQAAVAIWLVAATVKGEVLVHRVGAWPSRVGIVWVVDRLSAAMLLLAALVAVATTLYTPAALRGPSERRWMVPLQQLLLVGVNGSFVTGDLFNLFVFFEVMLVASFVLVSLGSRPSQLRQSFPYVVVNLLASGFFLAGVGLIYATAGTVNMAELVERLEFASTVPGVFWGALTLVLLVFGVKAALAPVFSWLPDAYPQAPLPVSALFAGLLTKVGVYALFRLVTLLTTNAERPLHDVLLAVSAATMLMGVLGALGRSTLRGILSFHIVSQVGYMVLGLSLFSVAGLAAGIFYVIHHIVVKTALFLAAGIVERMGGSGDLKRAHGIAHSHPTAAVAFFVPAMALAGMPPLSGFWGKLFLIIAGFQAGAYWATGVAVLVSLLTLASMLKIWFNVYWGEPQPLPHPARGRDLRLVSPALGLALFSVAIGAAAPLVWGHAQRTAAALMDRRAYVTAVLAEVGTRP